MLNSNVGRKEWPFPITLRRSYQAYNVTRGQESRVDPTCIVYNTLHRFESGTRGPTIERSSCLNPSFKAGESASSCHPPPATGSTILGSATSESKSFPSFCHCCNVQSVGNPDEVTSSVLVSIEKFILVAVLDLPGQGPRKPHQIAWSIGGCTPRLGGAVPGPPYVQNEQSSPSCA